MSVFVFYVCQQGTKLKCQPKILFSKQLIIEKWMLPEKSAYNFISEKFFEQNASILK